MRWKTQILQFQILYVSLSAICEQIQTNILTKYGDFAINLTSRHKKLQQNTPKRCYPKNVEECQHLFEC